VTITILSTDLRRQVREVQDRVRREREPIIVRTYDTPQAVLIPYEQFEVYQIWRERQQKRGAWLGELRSIAEQVSARVALSDEDATG
jgi:PHD/YefM family antitoxin component YafN of YafNO toxin-antitoxin module